jgi:hypothetical protein
MSSAVVSAQQCFIPGECTNSLLVGATYPETSKECLEDCKNLEQCHWFTFKSNGPQCELFKTCTDISVETCDDCLSGEVSCVVNECGIQGLCLVRYSLKFLILSLRKYTFHYF